jgi:hypothetical protein
VDGALGGGRINAIEDHIRAGQVCAEVEIDRRIVHVVRAQNGAANLHRKRTGASQEAEKKQKHSVIYGADREGKVLSPIDEMSMNSSDTKEIN